MTTAPARHPAARPIANPATRRAAARRRAQQRRHPRVSRLLAWLLAAWLGHAGLALAQVAPGVLPSGGQVMVGSGQLQLSPNLLVIQQNSNRLGLDWQSFNIGSGATVEFRQPGASSIALNRVVGNSGTEIYGQLKANGQVFLTNPNGVLFAPGAKVDVGGLVASTLDLSQQDFADGRYVFNAGAVQGSVVNQGQISASAGGYLALFGQRVDNQGDLSVQAGSVVLASGRAATVSISGSGLISAVVAPGTVQGSVDNGGRITADGGVVTLSARSAQDIAASLVNNSGIVRANTLVEKAGEIWITGDNVSLSGQATAAAPAGGSAGRIMVLADMGRGTAHISGTLDASTAGGGQGGFVETSAAHVTVAEGTRVTTSAADGKTGTWLIDPNDYTVAVSGGNITGSLLSSNLANNHIVITTVTDGTPGGNGDIFIDDAVSWGINSLTLVAERHIRINSAMTGSGTASLALQYGQAAVAAGNTATYTVAAPVALPAGNSFSTKLGSDGATVAYTVVNDLAALQNLDGNSAVLAGNYALGADIDASSTSSANGGLGFNPIGNEASVTLSTTNSFSGRFDGLGHTISGLVIARPTAATSGLFGNTNNATIRNLTLSGGSVSGLTHLGAVVGLGGGSTSLDNVHSSSSVANPGATGAVGGLVGTTTTGTIANGSVGSAGNLATISGGLYTGGLVGNGGTGAITNSHAHVALTSAGTYAGGLAAQTDGAVSGSSSTGAVQHSGTGTDYVGGLVGRADGAVTISNVTSSVDVTSTNASSYVGGLLGSTASIGVGSASSSGNVSGGNRTGGLVGDFSSGSTGASITNASTTGAVSGTASVGGLVGYAAGNGSLGTISASGLVTNATTTGDVGGAVGYLNLTGTLTAVSSSGTVSGGGSAGGVIGNLASNLALTPANTANTSPASGTKTVTGGNYAGGVVGYSASTAAISGYTGADALGLAVTATGSSGGAGGLAGRTNGPVSDIAASGTVNSAGSAGGVVGVANGAGGFSNLTASGAITATGTGGAVGGLVGSYSNSGSLSGASASGAVQGGSGSGATTGGLVGSFSSAGSIVNASTATTSTVAGGGDTGGLVGDATGTGGAAITGSTARGTVSGASNVGYVGGLVGDFSMPGGWDNVTAEGAVTGGNRTGGLAGSYSSAATIANGTYTPASVSGGTWVGGLVGYISSTAAITGTSAAERLTVATDVVATGNAGGLVGYTAGNVSNVRATGSVTNTGTGTFYVGGLIGQADGTGGVTDAAATGTVSAATLAGSVGGLIGYGNFGSIVRGGATNASVTGGRYTGGLVGYYAAGAGNIQNATVSANVSGLGDAGGLVGYADGSGSITDSSATGTVTSSATSTYSVGGAVGYFNMTGGMSSVSASGSVSGGAQTGGVVGYWNPTTAMAAITSSATTVSGVTWAGGIVGYSTSTAITGLSSAAAVTTTGSGGGAGGLAGRTNGSVSGSSASGNVVAGGDAGGLIGRAEGTGALTTVSATGSVTSSGTSARVGGLVGYATSGTIQTGTATGAVSGGSYAGGLVGVFSNNGNILDSRADGNVSGATSAGGLAGYTSGTGRVGDSIAVGNVTALSNNAGYGGGLVAEFAMTGGISGSEARGVVTNGSSAGGLVGYYNTAGALTTSQFLGGSVSGGTWVGGLVGYGQTGALTSLSVNATVTASGNAGGLAGRTSGSISGSSAAGNVTGATSVGGLIGVLDGSATVSGSSATGTVTNTGSNEYAGGLIGLANGGSVTSSSASGAVSGGQYIGGLIGRFNSNGNIQGNTASGNVSGSYDVGGLIGYASGTGMLSNNLATGSATSSTSSASVGGLAGYFAMSGGQSGNEARGNVSGGYYSGGLIGYYNVGTAITDGTYAGNSVSGGEYTGGLIGYSVASSIAGITMPAGLTVTGTGRAGGLAGRTGGSVSSSSASGAVSGGNYVGGLIGEANGTGTLTDVSASGNVSGGSNVGGLVGYDNGPGILRGTATGTVSTTVNGADAGGLVGQFSSGNDIRNSRAEGNVSSPSSAGGLVGHASGAGGLYDSVAIGRVTGTTNSGNVGGLVGSFYQSGGMTTVEASGLVSGGGNTGGLVGYYNSSGALTAGQAKGASVTGNSIVGGLVGQASTMNVTDSNSIAAVSSSGSYAGGLVGHASGSGSISASTASGTVTGNAYVGGLAGWLDGYSISNSNASGNVSAIADSVVVGGLVGQYGYYYYSSGQTITGSHATGSVVVDAPYASVGGLVGQTYSGNVTGSSASGIVTALDSSNTNTSGHYTGGLVGLFSSSGGSISSSTASGAVTGRYYTGGLVGQFSGASISGSSATGAVVGTQIAGGLAGYFSGTAITDSSASGSVYGTSAVGGLAGYLYNSATSTNISATGNVTAPSGASYVGGLAGQQSGAGITNGFASGKVTAGTNSSYVGGLVGYMQTSSGVSNGAALNDSAATGEVSGGTSTGGLVGYFYNYYGYGGIVNSHATGAVRSDNSAGGLVGDYLGYTANGQDIQNSYATGDVSGLRYAGGLVGNFTGANGIITTYATGAVIGRGTTSDTYLGGLVGYYNLYSGGTASTGTSRSYATGSVSLASGAPFNSGTDVYAGGLIGFLTAGAGSTTVALTDTYATGAVTVAASGTLGNLRAGGLVGNANASILRAYATGEVAATGGSVRSPGGLVGQRNASATVTDAIWDSTSTGQATSAGGTALTSAEMQQAASFPTWDLATDGSGGKTWRIYEGHTAPLLSAFLTPLTITLADASKVYDGDTSFGNASLIGSSGAVAYPERIFTTASAPDVGTYNVAAAGIYSVQNGYDLTVAGSATLTVTQRPLTLAGVIANKVYDGTRTATVVGTAQPTGLVAGEDLVVDIGAVSAVFDTKIVGTNKTVTVSGYTLADGTKGKASNYSIGSATSTTASITPAALLAGGFTAADRTYDGSTLVAVTATPAASLGGVIAGDTVFVDLSAVSSGTVANRNVGTAKPVAVTGIALTGADAGNYTVSGADGVTVNIAPKAVTVNALTGITRAYNAGSSVQVSTGTGVISGLVGSDVVELQTNALTGTLQDKNVGTDKPVTVANVPLRGPDAANYTGVAGAVSVDITPATAYQYVYRTTGSDKVYDGTNTAVANVILYGVQGSDDLSLTYDAPTFADKNVAYATGGAVTSKAISISNLALTGSDASNYTLNTSYYGTSTTGTISPKSLTVTGVAATDRVYDGTRDVSVNVSGASVDLTAKISGDDVGVVLPTGGTVTGQVATKAVGTNKPVTVPGFTLTGADAGNYTLTGSAGVTVNISRKDLSASFTGVDRAYDGSTGVRVIASSTDIVSGDAVSFSVNDYYYYYSNCYYYCGTFTGTGAKNVGTDKAVVVNNVYLTGNDAGNYTLTNPDGGTTTASVTPKVLSSLAYNGSNKVYDGTTTATVTLNKGNSGIFSSDTVTSTQDAIFSGTGAKNVGTGKTVDISNITLGGVDASNYSVSTTTASATANITPKPVTFSGIAAVNRAYDGSTVVAVNATGVTSSGFVLNDDVTVVQPTGGLTSGSIASKDVGTGKAVTVTGLTLGGTDSANYSIDSAASGILVDITPKSLTASYVGVNRPYNRGVTAQVTGSSLDIVVGDTITFSQNAIFTGLNAENAGTNKPISITGITIGGADQANYALLNTTASAFADITAKALTVSYTATGRDYNGLADTSITVTPASTGVVAGDVIGFTQAAVLRNDGAAGTGKPVDITGITLTGAQATNYSLTATTATTTANIAQRPIGVSGITAADRNYDGTTQVAINVANAAINTAAVISGDDVTVVVPGTGISTGTMLTKDVGQSKDVQVTGLGITGAQASNYTLTGAFGLTVNIAPRPLTAVYTAANKVYNGTAEAQVTSTSSDILAGDIGALGITASGAFSAGKGAGTGKEVAVSGGFLTGVERNNYSLVNPTGLVTADITPKSLTPVYTGGSRIYDGSLIAPVGSQTAGIVSGDVVAFGQTAVFTDGKNVGTGKPIAISGIVLAGADAANYSLSSTGAVATGSVTAKPITVTGLGSVTATDRVYDGSTTVTVTVPTGVTLVPDSSDIVAGDTVAISVPTAGTTTGTMVDKHVGAGKSVAITGLTLSGADAGNYVVAGAAGVTVDITPKLLTASYAGVTRVYDGGVNVAVLGTSSDILTGDVLGIAGSGIFTGSGAKNVGTAKAIQVDSATLSGADRANYTLINPTGTAFGDITSKTLVASYAAITRVYDGTVNAAVTASGAGVVGGDNVSFDQTAVFSGAGARNVGNAKPIAVSGITLSGADAGNYELASTSASTTGSITPRPITLTGLSGVTAVDRVYDGTATVEVNLVTTGTVAPTPGDILAGDTVTVSVPSTGATTGTMANKNVGNNKPVLTIAGLGLSGADAANYSLVGASGLTVTITPKSLTAIYTGTTRVYDGSVAAAIVGSSGDILGGDAVSISPTGVFTGVGARNVGTGKAIAVTGASLSGADAVNYSLVNTTGSATGDVTPKTVTVNYTGGTRVYDGTVTAPVGASIAGLVTGDAVAPDATAEFTGNGAKNVGNAKAVAVSGITLTGTDAGNYALTITSANTTASVTPRPLRIDGLTGVSAADRVYDGTSVVSVTVASTGPITPNAQDLIAGDDITLTAPPAGTTTGTMVDKHVGSAKPVTVAGLSLGGADAPNYSIAATSGVTVNIAPKQVTAVYTGVTRTYDGSTTASVVGSTTDLVAGDIVGISGSGLYTGSGAKNAGAGKPLDVLTAALSGADSGDYSLVNPTASTTGTVTTRVISASFIGGTKVYDGTVTAPVSGTALGFVQGDIVSLSGSAEFTGAGAKNVGTGKAVSVSGITLAGDDAPNYSLVASSAGTTASITPRPLRVDGLTGITATDRVYDGTNAVSVAVQTSGALSPNAADVVAGDDVTVSLPAGGVSAGTMADKHAGLAKPVVVAGLALGGADGGNYSVDAALGLTVNIAPKQLTASYVGIGKVYDGTALADVGGTSADIVAGDLVTIAGTGVFNGGKNVGTSKAVDITAGSLLGADSLNYSLVNTTGVTSADITPRLLTIAYTGGTRAYDGTLMAPVTADRSGFVSGDDLSLSQSASFSGADGKNVGTGKAVAVSGISLAGADAGNYGLASTTATTTASVTPRPLNVSGLSNLAAVDRVYDGTRTVQLVSGGPVGSASGDVLPGDVVTIGLPSGGLNAGTMVDKAVGTAKSVAVAGLTLAGTDAANYEITGTVGVTVNITPKDVQLTGVTAQDRVYDGSIAVNISTTGGSIVGAIAGDDLQLPTTGLGGSMADRHVGSAKAVSVSGLSLSGTDAGNYTVSGGTGITVNITPRALVVTAQGADKVYDGGTVASVALQDDRISGDGLTLAYGSASFADRHVGSAKAVAIDGITLTGTDAGNYLLAGTAAASTAGITPRTLTATATASDKVYDGSTAASYALLDDRVAGDALALGAAGAAFADKQAGSAKQVLISGLQLSGADAGNYQLGASTATASASITPRPLQLTATVAARVYDGSTVATAVLDATNLVPGDALTLADAGASFDNKDAGDGKAVTVSGITLGGADAGNYLLAGNTTSTTASILRRPATVTGDTLSKVYGESVNLTGAEFTTLGLVAGESIGLVTLASNGTDATAAVTGLPYAIAVSDARAGSFNPTNYALTYASGALVVTPRPLTIAANSVVRSTDEPNPNPFGFSTSVGSLINGDSVASVLINAPAGSATAAGGSIFELVPSGAVFGAGQASNYALSYDSGLLVVLPRPPRVDDVDPNAGNTGQQGFAVQVDQAELERALDALQRNASVVAQTGADTPPGLPLALRNVDATAAEISVALAGDGRRITLPALLRLPLISFDPNLRRLIFGPAAGSSTPPSSNAP